MANAPLAIGVACSLAIVAGWNATNLRSVVDPPHPVAGLDANDTSASASLLGQFRTNTSAWLWLRTDLYLHNGVELRPLTNAEKRAGMQGVGSSEKDLSKALNEDSVVTSIPSPDRDFRGWFGDLDRATAPYKTMKNHSHNNPEQAIPLFRLMTWIDPNFIEGWTVGSTVIARDRSNNGTDKAIKFLNEGLKQNPESISILNELAFAYITRKKDLRTAVEYLELSRASAVKYRGRLPDDEKDEAAQIYRWLGLCYRDLGERDKMSDAVKEGLSMFPDDGVLAILGDQPPLILSNTGKAAWEKQRADSARATTAQTETEAHDLH